MARKLVGTVASDVQEKTIVVAVARRVTHPVYGKQYTVTKRFAAHDEDNVAHIGDKVEIVETRPISKNKTFRLSRVIETGHANVELKDETEAVTKKPAEEEKEA
jgi:small subunit ribosomal protein S17